jgi:trehalose 6-phosphate synthase
MESNDTTRLVVISNRLPIVLTREDDEWSVKPGAGGLVSALAPVLKNRGGLWIGWSGAMGDVDIKGTLDEYSREAGYGLRPVLLSKEEVDGYYYGFANEVLWPLFHDFQSRCNFKPSYWRSYLDVNLKFAEVVGSNSKASDYIWVHDYHLMHLAFLLRNMGLERRCGFFLHTPFPAPDIFLKLPWRAKIIRSLLDFDLVGLHTRRDAMNFVDCVKVLVPEAKVDGQGQVMTCEWQGRSIRIGSFPISIDYDNFKDISAAPATGEKVARIKEGIKHRKLILGVDRLDYTKGIPQRLEAIRETFNRYPDLRGKMTFVQVAVPSRTDIPEYKQLKEEIERLVGEINGQFTDTDWVPIRYMFRSLPREELVAYYRAADMALVTPLRDGMNLVAKEYCAANIDETGVLFLSEFAGAAAQLQQPGAILVNPYDVEGVARSIRRAFYMDEDERKRRMAGMRESVKKADIFWWVDSFLKAAFSRQLEDFPPMESVDFHTQQA